MAIVRERLHRITVDIYERMAATGLLPERGVELLDGLVLEMSPKDARHAFAVGNLAKQFILQSRERYLVSPDSLSLRLGPSDMPDPDIALARATRNYARARPEPDEIALIVEVADSSLAVDLGTKLSKYAAGGIPEYWVVDLQNDVVHIFRAPGVSDYGDRGNAAAGELISPCEFPDVAIDVAKVMGT